MSTPRLLILGRSGQLAGALSTTAHARFDARALGRGELDLSQIGAIGPAIEAALPDVVINAAAHTAVDLAETDSDAAFALNRDAPGAIAAACERMGVPLVHVSTDFVFDGDKGAPYVEADAINALGVYGRSKAAGEQAVRESGARATILRTSWVYGAEGKNFVRTMLRLAGERDVLRVVDDQRGRPTYVGDLADAVLCLARALLDGDARAEGVMHFANSGEASWADLAEAAIAGAARRGGPSARVERIATADYPTPARRPKDSRLDLSRYAAWAGAPPPEWRDGLERCLDQIYSRALRPHE